MTPELQRFIDEIQQDPKALGELERRLEDPEAAIRWAEARGYSLTREDVLALAESRELSEEELEAAAGGEEDWGTGTGNTTGGGG
jgi:predicted ribosomally synthesized peptide with nif11-like leader